jgi:electron transport complex protein RnfB
MMIEALIIATAAIAFIGLVFGIILAVAGKKLAVQEDPRVDTVYNILPHANCGACGFPSCIEFAKAVVKDPAHGNKCRVGGKVTAEQIGNILHVALEATEKLTVRLLCTGGKKCKDKFEYRGVKTCKNAVLVSEGHKACVYGCVGFGDCVSVCEFGALHIGENDIPVVDHNKCTACGKCVSICPRKLFALAPVSKKSYVACSSHYGAKEVVQKCSIGCISCGICEKSCPEKAIKIENNLASIKYENCKNKYVCVDKCPRKVILKIE